MKRTQMEKLKGARIAGGMGRVPALDRYGKDSGALSRREQRKLDQARGLVSFAAKLDGGLVQRLRERAQARGIGVDELVAELLDRGLAG